jgi:hypothetical protein
MSQVPGDARSLEPLGFQHYSITRNGRVYSAKGKRFLNAVGRSNTDHRRVGLCATNGTVRKIRVAWLYLFTFYGIDPAIELDISALDRNMSGPMRLSNYVLSQRHGASGVGRHVLLLPGHEQPCLIREMQDAACVANVDLERLEQAYLDGETTLVNRQGQTVRLLGICLPLPPGEENPPLDHLRGGGPQPLLADDLPPVEENNTTVISG